MTRRHAGFTINELMITVAVIAVLATIAAPSVTDLVRNTRMTGLANDMMTDLAIARAEAVKRGVRVALCARPAPPADPAVPQAQTCTGTDWKQGWIIYADSDGDGIIAAATDIVKLVAPVEGDIVVTGAGETTNASGGRYVEFRPSGLIAVGGGGQTTFTLCDSRNTAAVGANLASLKGRVVTVTGTGRASATRVTCATTTG